MANGIKTLVNISNVFDEYESPKEAYEILGKEVFLKAVHDYAVIEQESYLGDIVDYFLDFQEDDEWIAGILNSKELQECVKNWNKNLLNEVCDILTRFEKVKDKWGLNSVADLFVQLENGRNCDDFNYSTELYRFHRAISDLEGSFLYGNGNLVLEQENYGTYVSIKLSDATVVNAIEHPDEYAVIYTYYK